MILVFIGLETFFRGSSVMRRFTLDPLLLIVALGAVALVYILMLPACDRSEIRGPAEIPPIYSLGPYYAITDQGRLLPGQTYQYRNEGPWVGDHTLLFVFLGHAALITHYPVHHPCFHHAACRAVFP